MVNTSVEALEKQEQKFTTALHGKNRRRILRCVNNVNKVIARRGGGISVNLFLSEDDVSPWSADELRYSHKHKRLALLFDDGSPAVLLDRSKIHHVEYISASC